MDKKIKFNDKLNFFLDKKVENISLNDRLKFKYIWGYLKKKFINILKEMQEKKKNSKKIDDIIMGKWEIEGCILGIEKKLKDLRTSNKKEW